MRDDWKTKRKEWKDEYNSFNSNKGFTYSSTHYFPIANWLEGKGKLPPPIELSLDPAHLCNFVCGHCNAQRYLVTNLKEVPADKKIMTKEHLHNLIDFVSDWGVKGICVGGGGEPLMNKNAWDLPSYIHKKGMESGIPTNGSLINEQIANEMMYARWVGVSLDAGTREVYKKVHGVDCFDKVIKNLELLVKTKEKTGSKVDLACKYLIRPDNWEDIETACKLSKKIGVQDFHVRPADLERKDVKSAIEINYNIDAINDIFESCHHIEDENFKVYTIVHKYNPKFRVEHTFNNCVSSSLMLQACSDGNAYVCADHRLENRFKLGSHYPDPKNILNFWGSDEHRKLLKSIKVDSECGRCTYGKYAEQIERLAIGIKKIKTGKGQDQYKEMDPMCVNFP